MAVEGGVPAQRTAVEYALEFFLSDKRIIGKGRCDIYKGLAVEPMHGEVDAEAMLGAIDELLAEGDADIGNRKALSVLHDRRHGENTERIPPGFNADDRFAGLVQLHHGGTPCRDVLAEMLRIVDTVEGDGWWRMETDQRHSL